MPGQMRTGCNCVESDLYFRWLRRKGITIECNLYMQSSQDAYHGGGNAQGSSTTADDEAYARKLQEQFNMENGGNQHGPQAPNPSNATNPSAPSWRQRWDSFVATPPQDLCKGCKKPVLNNFGGGSYLTALGGKWHPGTGLIFLEALNIFRAQIFFLGILHYIFNIVKTRKPTCI